MSNITNNNGTISAVIGANCTATLGNNTVGLQVSDGSFTATTNLTVNVLANTPPALSYDPITVAFDHATNFFPATSSDNGAIATYTLQSQGAYTGWITVDPNNGQVWIEHARPQGAHTITIRATDNCGATTDTSFSLQVVDAAPLIAPVGMARQQGNPASNSTIATVSDLESAPGSLVVTVTNVPAGLTISNVVNSNGSSPPTSRPVAPPPSAPTPSPCMCPTVRLQPMLNLTINVFANVAPVLTYNSSTVAKSNSTTVSPATASDNGTLSFALQSQGTYTGTISVNSSTGAVSISNAGPVGTHTITVRATDNCGAITDAMFSISIYDPGSVDSLDANIPTGVGTQVNAHVVQTDGKIIIGGTFTSVLGVARNHIARLNADGTLDMGFDPNAAPSNAAVQSILVQTDGKILIGGSFLTLQPNGAPSSTSKPRLARLNYDGTIDGSFDPRPNSTVNAIVLQPDGLILVGGNFTSFNPNGAGSVGRNRVARLNPDGTVDTVFNRSVSSQVFSVALQGRREDIDRGQFITVGSSTRNRIARLLADSTVDSTLIPTQARPSIASWCSRMGKSWSEDCSPRFSLTARPRPQPETASRGSIPTGQSTAVLTRIPTARSTA